MSQPLIIARCRDQSSQEGTGSYLINEVATPAYQTIKDGLPDGAEVEYYVEGVTEDQWEVARGIWDFATRILTRASILSSSTGSAIAWGPGDKKIGIIFGPTRMALLGDGKVGGGVGPDDIAVSYTHLRAHETDAYR